MASLETRILLRTALYNVRTAKNHSDAIKAITAMCEPEDRVIVDKDVSDFFNGSPAVEEADK